MKRTLISLGLMATMFFLIGAKGCNLEQSCYISNIEVLVDCFDEAYQCFYLADQRGEDEQCCYDEFDECAIGYANKIMVCAPADSCLKHYAACMYNSASSGFAYWEMYNCWKDLDACAEWYDDGCDIACFEDYAYCADFTWSSLSGLQECADGLCECQHGCWE